MYSGIGSGLLGLEMPLHPQQQPQASQNPQTLHLHHQSHQLSAFGDQSGKHSSSYAFASNPKPTTPNSDEDEAGGGDPKRKMSPWQRMKWTDNMVRLLIMAVYYIGDEVGSESSDPAGKKKPAGGGLLQKKGKWKSVSRAMMEKGFYVSPQQCEDKFNDLNKRYKRVNDILGRGTACRVVENQTLLETMEIPPKMKEEARKLLNSKHLFFREMCAYHNSCGHGTGTPPPPPAGPAEIAANEPPSPHLQQPAQPLCYHTSDNSQMAVNSRRNEGEAVKLIKAGSDEEDEEEDDDDDNDDDDDDDEESEDESEDEDMEEATDQCRGHGGHENDDNNNNNNTTPNTNTNNNNNNESHSHSHSHSSQKRQRKGGLMTSSLMGQLNSEVGSMMQDGTKSEWEKKQWVRMRLRQLEEQQVKYEYQALELEKQRLKWIKFSSKKERELEKAKLENQRRRLETERMALFVRHKEMELLDHHHRHQIINNNNNNIRADPSTITGYENRVE